MKQTNLWNEFVEEAISNRPYVSFKDKKPHCLKFTSNTPQKSTEGKYGPEMRIEVDEMGIEKQLTITQPMARELAKECIRKNVNISKLKGHIFTLTRRGTGYSTFYMIEYGFKEEIVRD